MFSYVVFSVSVESFLLLSLGAFPVTSSADSKTTLVRLSFKLSLHIYIHRYIFLFV